MDGELRHWRIKAFTQTEKEILCPSWTLNPFSSCSASTIFPPKRLMYSKINLMWLELFSKTRWDRSYFSIYIAEGQAEEDVLLIPTVKWSRLQFCKCLHNFKHIESLVNSTESLNRIKIKCLHMLYWLTANCQEIKIYY